MAEAERTGDVTYRYISASGYARQQNGNITNQYARHIYQLRRRTSDSTLRRDQRNTALLTAAAEGQTPRIRHLLDLGVDLDHSDDYGFTALHHAALSGFEDTVEVVLEAGADVNASSLDCGTALHLAALKSRAKIVELLLRYRANVNRTSRLLGSVVHCASYAGDEAIVGILDAHMANLDQVTIVLPSLLRSVSREGDYSPQLPYAPNNHDFLELSADSLITSDYSGVLQCLPSHLATLTGKFNLTKILGLPPSSICCHAWNPISLDDEGLSRPSHGSIETKWRHMLIVRWMKQEHLKSVELEYFGKPIVSSKTARKLTGPMMTGSSASIASQAIDRIAAAHERNDMNTDSNDETDVWYEATEIWNPAGSESIKRQSSETAENSKSEQTKSQVQASVITMSGTVVRDQYDDDLSHIADFGQVKNGGRELGRPLSAGSLALRAEADRLTTEVSAHVNDEQIIHEPSASLQVTSSRHLGHKKEPEVYGRAADLGPAKTHFDTKQDPQIDEDKRQAALRASAVSMAKSMYERLNGNVGAQHEGASAAARNQAATHPNAKAEALAYISLQDAAHKLAAERLARIDKDMEACRFREIYSHEDKPKRLSSTLTMRSVGTGGRKAAKESATNVSDSDDDEAVARRIRQRIANLGSAFKEVDVKRQQEDRAKLLAAAEKRVSSRMHDMDQRVHRDTGT